MLDLRRLRYFVAIAEHGSMSAAARHLHLAQPALSYHVAELERLLGIGLFTRSRDGVTLTEPGQLLLLHARDIVARTDAAEAAMQALAQRDRPPAHVRIAVISSLAADLIPILVATVAAHRPEVTLSLSEAGTREIEQKLQRGEADMAVYLTIAPGSVEQPVATEQLYFLSPRTGAEATGGISLAAMAAQRLVLPSRGNPLRAFIKSVARDNGLTLDVVLEVDGAGSRRNAVLNGIGSTILGAHSVASGADPGLSVREIVAPRLIRPIYLGARRDFDAGLAADLRTLLTAALLRLGLSAPQAG